MLCLWGAAGAQAKPVTYTIAASFPSPDNGSASGFFTFDADTSTYSNVSITVAGSATPALNGTYTFVCPPGDCVGFNPADANDVWVLLNQPPPPPPPPPHPPVDLTNQPVFALNFSPPLTDAGNSGTAEADYGFCSTEGCSGINEGPDALRRDPSAMLSGPVVPTLTDWGVAIFALLLSGFAVLRLRRTASA